MTVSSFSMSATEARADWQDPCSLAWIAVMQRPCLLSPPPPHPPPPAHASAHLGTVPAPPGQVTNRQYEMFDPSHKALRGKLGFSTGDDEAVVFVSHDDAVNYTRWLTAKTGRRYRLPTEAEWEWAGRGGNASTSRDYFWTGATVPPAMQNNQKDTGIPSAGLPLGVARFPANPLGLFDTIGNVEEWCADWYGPYADPGVAATDPQGPAEGTFRVTRGGSHSTSLYYLRTANRAGTLPGERSWYIGFRVVEDGPADRTVAPSQGYRSAGDPPAPRRAREAFAANTSSSWPAWSKTPAAPVVRRYVNIPSTGDRMLPFADHNHEPTIAACPNGDVVSSWYSTNVRGCLPRTKPTLSPRGPA